MALRMSLLAMSLVPLGGQWLHQPTAGIPRTAGGKPNLAAPAPKTADGRPDLSGLWRMNAGAYGGNAAADLKPGDLTPWAEKLYQQRMEDLSKDHMSVLCLPFGAGYPASGIMTKIVQTPQLIVLLYEDLTHRQIFLDGRALPTDPNPAWMGYSVGHWDGDALIVESNGFNDRSWLDFGGHPHTEALRITERIRRRDFGHLEIEVTFADPAVAAKPWTVPVKAEFAADTEMLEYVCQENEKDRGHLVGTASDDKKYAVSVSAAILRGYVGAYEFRSPEDPNTPIVLNVTMKGEELYLDFEGKDPQPMIPLSESEFSSSGGRMQFFKDEKGEVTHSIFRIVEGDLKGVRKK